MGRRRRSQKKVATKKRATVSKSFKCPFCSMDGSVGCKIDTQKGVASLECRVCGAKYQTTEVNFLTEPIDIFCEWLDRCQEENEAQDDEYADE
mmetsp:Transcript_21970/g.38912  ORF Transcript_21970/g.38912 Transcript_21970/m.38912 type:complete len:93 (-) Transcript_21970:133-411(-)